MIARLAILLTLAACTACDGQPAEQGVAIADARDAPPLRLPQVLGPANADLPLVVIDPGHGGRDPGALALGVSEKEVTLGIARAVRDALIDSGRVRVAMTRDDDRPIALQDRLEIARRLRADLFLSIHADAAAREGARGASIYTLSEVASDREAAALAKRENAVGLAAASDSANGEVGRILFDLAQRESLERAATFARLLHREASPDIPFREDYRRFAALAVLKSSEAPSLLFECGYLTNPQDVAFLRSEQGRKRIADAVRRAAETYFAGAAHARTVARG